MNDAMADYQQEYDQAVAQYGAESPEAIEAEQAAIQFLKGTRAPVTPVFQQEH